MLITEKTFLRLRSVSFIWQFIGIVGQTFYFKFFFITFFFHTGKQFLLIFHTKKAVIFDFLFRESNFCWLFIPRKQFVVFFFIQKNRFCIFLFSESPKMQFLMIFHTKKAVFDVFYTNKAVSVDFLFKGSDCWWFFTPRKQCLMNFHTRKMQFLIIFHKKTAAFVDFSFRVSNFCDEYQKYLSDPILGLV